MLALQKRLKKSEHFKQDGLMSWNLGKKSRLQKKRFFQSPNLLKVQ